ncbi:hypothetical protein JD793_004679 [Citrobacter braakii]|nr:hypothetical protein [Citrobacter braakii]
MTQVKTEKGTLLDGIPFNGSIHVDFELRLPVLADTGQALDDVEERFGTTEGYAPDAFYRAAVLASTLKRLGNIPAENLTAELLYDNLTPDDYDVLNNARGRLKGKRSGGNPGSSESDSQPSPSGDAVSAKNA